jgi:2-polyprenyl-3-methyl-5-hydroxy-6-metoxy-1,4-benzoquinol methylase
MSNSCHAPADVRCPLCLAECDIGIGKINGGKNRLVRCSACELDCIWPFDTGRSDAEPVYDSSYYEHGYLRNIESRRSQFKDLLSLLKSKRVRGPILDVGAGIGLFACIARELGYDVTTVEPSAHARRISQEQLGIRVDYTKLDEVPHGAQYATIVLWHVLPHVADLQQVLAHVRRLLSPGGLVLMGFRNWSHPRQQLNDWYSRWRTGEPLYAHTVRYRFRQTHLSCLAGLMGCEVADVKYFTRTERRPLGLGELITRLWAGIGCNGMEMCVFAVSKGR